MRRLTSGEYAYTIADLTGVEIDAGIDSSSDSVGGEGFTNFGDVQFMQDANVERYLEAAKSVADHAVIGSGPLEFFADPGKTGFEMSAIARIREIYGASGFRTVSGEGGRPFGLEKYGKAFYVAWRYKHRAALGEPNATLKSLAAREGISAALRRAHLVGGQSDDLGYPSSKWWRGGKALPAPKRRCEGDPREVRRAAEVRGDVAELALCARRRGGGRRGRRESADVQRSVAGGEGVAPLHV